MLVATERSLEMKTNLLYLRRVAIAVLLVAAFALAPIAFDSTRSARAQEQRDCPVRVTLLQVNDVYQFAPVDGGKRGGLGRVLTLRKQVMAESPHTIFLLAGDTISPSIESNTYKGSQMIEAWNAIGLDFATFGNHEFDFGPDVLRQRMAESKFKWLAANVTDKQTGKLFGGTPEFIIREFDGVKVGIFGIVLRETLQTSRPGPTVDIGDPCATAARVVPKIRAAGAKVIVALTHLAMNDDKQLARCSGVDVIIGGHEHTLLESLAGHAPIFKMTADARELGRIDLNISKSTGKLESIDWQVIPVTDQIKEDAAFAPLNEKYGPLLKSLEQVIGRTDVELNIKSADVRTRETNMADFIADTYRNATSSDVALVNGGSIRADTTINPGVMTKRDVLSMLPFNNKLVKIQISGAVLRSALEYGVASIGVEEQPGRFPQVSGILFSYDASRKPGARLTSVTVNGKALDDKATYTLTTTSYVAIDGGDGYTMFKGAKQLISPDQGPSESDVLQKAIASVNAIAPRVEGRITRVDAGKDQGLCQ
jgi:5'-nucleotidase